METKPGWKTSEFWLTAISMAVSLAFASGLIPTDSAIDKLLGLIAAALGGLGYSVSRGLAKKSSIIIICILGSGLVMGCSTLETNSFKVIKITTATVDKAMLSWGDYVKTGQATIGDEEKVFKAYESYQAVMRTARVSVETYLANKDRDKINQVLAQVQDVGIQVVAIVEQFTKKTK